MSTETVISPDYTTLVPSLAYSTGVAEEERRGGFLRTAPVFAAVFLGGLGMVCAAGATAYLTALTPEQAPAVAATVTTTVAAPAATVTAPATTVTETVTAQAPGRTIPDTPVSADDVYIKYVDNAGLWIYDAPPMIALGHAQCRFLQTAPTNTPSMAISALQLRYTALNPAQASGVVHGAIKAYCPQFEGRGE